MVEVVKLLRYIYIYIYVLQKLKRIVSYLARHTTQEQGNILRLTGITPYA